MAYDPQNPLDAITGERAKRGKKNPNARTVQNQDEATGVGPGTQRIQPRQTGGRFNIPTGRTTPYGLTQADNQRILADIAQSEREAGRKMPEVTGSVNTTPPAKPPAVRPTVQPKPTPSIEDQRLINRLREGGLPESIYANTPNMLQQLKQGTLSPEYKNTVEQAARYNYNQTPAMQQAVQTTLPFQGRAGFGDVRMREQSPPPAEPGSSPGLMTRSVQQPELGQVGVNAPTSIPPYLSNDRAALAAMERMRPQTSQRPQQATPSAAQPAVQPPAATPAMAQPEQAMIGPERQPNRARIDQLRAQIASEQQAMLAARRARGGSFREDTAPLERIAGMRQELAQYERAATPGQPIRVKTPEENLATEQSLARQASDIMARDLGADNIPAVSGQPLRGSAEDLRRQVATMPAGPERDAMAEQLRSLQYQQQQQAARAGALPAGAVGPQPMGASVELAEQMMGEARARTERQREAAPRVAARQQELADVAMREGERLTGKRQDVEQQRADFARATREATLAELSAPERARKEAFASEQSKREIAASQSQAEIAKTNALTESIIAKTGIDKEVAKIEAERARAGLNQILSAEPDVKEQRKTALEIQKLERDALALKIEQQRKADSGLPQTEEDFRKEQVIQEGLMRRAGVTPESEALVRNGLQALGQRVSSWNMNGKMAYASPADATEDIQHVNQFLNYESKLNTLYNSGPEGRRMAQLKARDLLASIPSDFGGYRPSVSGTLGAGAGGAAAGAAVGAAIGSVVPIAGTAIGAAIGAGIGAIAAGLTYDSFASDEESAQVVNKFNAAYASLRKMAGE